RRCDAVTRWRRAIGDGLTAKQAAQAVGVPRSTLYRWENDPQPKSRRPHKLRKPQWTRNVARTGEAARASATALLDKLIAEAPFPVRGIQVDGGSEFMAEFEAG